MTLLAAQTALWVALGLAVFAFAIVPEALLALYFALDDGGTDDVGDVQRFIELTEEARQSVPPGLPLLDHDKAEATTDAIVGFQAKKGEARTALSGKRRAA